MLDYQISNELIATVSEERRSPLILGATFRPIARPWSRLAAAMRERGGRVVWVQND